MSPSSLIKTLLHFIRIRLLWNRFREMHPLAEDECGLIVQAGIGDHTIPMGLAAEISLRYGLKVVVAAHPKFRFLGPLFPAIERFVALPDGLLKANIGLPDILPGAYTSASIQSIFRAVGYNDFQFSDAYKCIFRLKPSASLNFPNKPTLESVLAAKNYLISQNLTPGKCAIICADTGLTPTGSVGMDFWAELCGALLSAGVTPVCNQGPKQTLLPGIQPLNIDLSEFRAVALAAGHVFAARSGICDLICDIDCKKTFVYPIDEFTFGSLYSWANFKNYNLRSAPVEILLDASARQSLLLRISSGNFE
jgi:hypothetical protein